MLGSGYCAQRDFLQLVQGNSNNAAFVTPRPCRGGLFGDWILRALTSSVNRSWHRWYGRNLGGSAELESWTKGGCAPTKMHLAPVPS